MKLYQKIARVLSQKNKSLNVIEKELTLLKELLPNGNVIGLQRHNLSTPILIKRLVYGVASAWNTPLVYPSPSIL